MQNTQQLQNGLRQPAGALPAAGLVTCSICLRVQRGVAWVEAEDVIRELRTYDLSEPVHLRPGLCEECHDALEERRGYGLDQGLAEAA